MGQLTKEKIVKSITDKAVYGIDTDGAEVWKYQLENTVDQAAFGNKEYIVLAFQHHRQMFQVLVQNHEILPNQFQDKLYFHLSKFFHLLI